MTSPSAFSLRLGGSLMSLDRPKVMGILNLTPDSFFAGSRVSQTEALLRRAEQMLNEGADFLDVGGYSTRPGASPVPVAEEQRRVREAIQALVQAFPEAHISVDTFRASVVEVAVGEGAVLINDVSGGSLDPQMFQTVARLRVPYVLMHLRGTPQTMMTLNQYEDLLLDIIEELQARLVQLRRLGVSDVILDPGFGFAKNIPQNFQLLRQLPELHLLGCPLLVGLSRKSMIYKMLHITAEQALNGSTVLHTLALEQGAHILRVHDVKAAREAVQLWVAFRGKA